MSKNNKSTLSLGFRLLALTTLTLTVLNYFPAAAQEPNVKPPVEAHINNRDDDRGVNVGVPIMLTPKKNVVPTSAPATAPTVVPKDGKDKSKSNALYPSFPPCASWIDEQVKPRASVLCIHGLGLNTDAFNSLGVRLAKRGIATYAIDVRGFGSWLQNKGHEQLNFKATLGDIGVTAQAIKAANQLPLFILGESMGGAIAIQAAAEYQAELNGLISSAPSGERFDTTGTDLKVAVEFMTGPKKQFDIGKSIIDQATNNQELRHIWQTDPLNRQDLSADELMQFQAFMNKSPDAAKKIDSVPVLVLQGTLDKLVKPEGTWQIFNTVASKQKTFIALPSEHLVLEDGQTKTTKYDERAALHVASWMFNSQEAPSAAAAPATGEAPKIATTGTPQTLIFEAPWCHQCDETTALAGEAANRYGSKVILRRINVDKAAADSADSELITRLQIGPLPTYVFVGADGTVTSTLIGRSGSANFLSAAAEIAL